MKLNFILKKKSTFSSKPNQHKNKPTKNELSFRFILKTHFFAEKTQKEKITECT